MLKNEVFSLPQSTVTRSCNFITLEAAFRIWTQSPRKTPGVAFSWDFDYSAPMLITPKGCVTLCCWAHRCSPSPSRPSDDLDLSNHSDSQYTHWGDGSKKLKRLLITKWGLDLLHLLCYQRVAHSWEDSGHRRCAESRLKQNSSSFPIKPFLKLQDYSITWTNKPIFCVSQHELGLIVLAIKCFLTGGREICHSVSNSGRKKDRNKAGLALSVKRNT